MGILFALFLMVISDEVKAQCIFGEFIDEDNEKWLKIENTYLQHQLLKSIRWRPIHKEFFPFEEVKLRLYVNGLQKIDLIFMRGIIEHLDYGKEFINQNIGTTTKRRFKAESRDGIEQFLTFFETQQVFGKKFRKEVLKALGK